MKTLMLTGADGPESANIVDVETPAPEAGQVRVAIKAAAFNHREIWIAQGLYPGMQLPCTMCCDGAGVVEAVGEGVDATLVGQEVVLYPGLEWGPDPRYPAADFGLLGMPGPGTMSEFVCVSAKNIAPKPAFLSFEQAAAVPLAGLTAWRGLVTKAGLKKGEKVLITGIGGGVATFALKFAVAMGAEVYVTSGSDETLAKAQALGAAGGFNYKDENWRKAVGKATGGIDVVFDGAPANSLPNYIRALSMGARVVVYGSTGGMQIPVSATDLFLKNIQIIGTNVGNPQEFSDMLAFVEESKLEPVMDCSFDFEQAKDALLYLGASHKLGKIVVNL